MPPIVKITKAPARSRRDVPLEMLVFRYGGVAGAVRSIMRGAGRPLTMNQIQAVLEDTHPRLKPAKGQIEMAVQTMVEQRLIAMRANAKTVRTFKWSPEPRPDRPARREKANRPVAHDPNQLSLEL